MDLGPSTLVCHSSNDVALHYDLKAVQPHFTGKVVGVADGDTITVMHQGRGDPIRLYGIDAPERGQPFTNPRQAVRFRPCFGRETFQR